MDSSADMTDLPQPDLVPPTSIEPQLGPGSELFKRFILQRELGHGRCSTSWLVEDPRFRRSLVLKLFRSSSLEETPEERNVWRGYLRRLRVLNHPDIVMSMEFFHSGTQIALSNAFENGSTLADLTLKAEKKLPDNQVEAALKTIGLALVAAFEKFTLVHGNLNAFNLIVSARRGTPKITDFGFHPPLPPPGVDRNEPQLSWKLACLSLERLQGAPPSHEDDLYAYAAVAFQLFTGKNPPLQESGQVNSVTAGEWLADAPEPWRRQLLAVFDTDPEKRPKSLANLLREMNLYEAFTPRVQDDRHIQAQAISKKKPRTSKSPDNKQTFKRLRFRLLTLVCVIFAPASLGYIIYRNVTSERALESERVKAEVQEKAKEAEETAEIVKLNERLGTDFSTSKNNLALYMNTMGTPTPTPKPASKVINSGARGFFQEGTTRFAAGDFIGAMESYELAIVLQPDWPDLLEARGAALLANHQEPAALLEFSQALILEPARISALLGRAKANLATGDQPAALADLQAVLKLDQQNAEATALIEKNNLSLQTDPELVR